MLAWDHLEASSAESRSIPLKPVLVSTLSRSQNLASYFRSERVSMPRRVTDLLRPAVKYLQRSSLLILFWMPILSQQASTLSKQRNLTSVRQEDEGDHPAQNTPEAIARFEQRGRDRSKEVRALLVAGELRSADDLYKAAFVLQHGETSEDYLLAHVLATDSL